MPLSVYGDDARIPTSLFTPRRWWEPRDPTETELMEHLRNGGVVETKYRETAEKYRVLLEQEGFAVTIAPHGGNSPYPWKVTASHL